MKEKIEKAIIEGLKESYEDHYSFTGEISSIVKPESLIHINIAKKIRRINDENKSWGKPLLIKLEESTFRFATSCVPFKADPNNIFSTDYRDHHNSSRSGNIDIALYTEGDDIFDDKPYAAIEVKDFISTRGELRQDIIRNIEFLTLKDKFTGDSRLSLAYVACIHEHKGALKKEDKNSEIEKLKNGYKNYMNRFDLDSKRITYRIEIQTISEYLLSKEDYYLPQEIMEDKTAQAIHFIGAIIVLEKIKK